MIKFHKPVKERIIYAFDDEAPGNYGTGDTMEKAEQDLRWKQIKKSEILQDFNDLEVFAHQETREYMAGLISRNWEEIKKIREEIRENET
jgi:hypothetical protein